MKEKENFMKVGNRKNLLTYFSKKLLVTVLFCLSAVTAETMEINQIVLPENPSPWDSEAASELNLYHKKINGKELPIYHYGDAGCPAGNGIYLGDAALKKGLVPDADAKKLKPDGYLLYSNQSNLGIYGTEAAGVLYGVCGLLNECGVKIYGADCETLPGKLDFPSDINNVVNPAFFYRPLEPGFFTWRSYYRDMKPVRLGFTAQFTESKKIGEIFFPLWLSRKSGFGESGHTMQYIIPQSEYLKTNPEYFSHDAEGKLIENKQGHLCLTNSDVARIIKSTVMNWVEKAPYSSFFFVAQPDMDAWCQCSNCRALDPFPGKKADATRWTNLSDRILHCVNPVAKAVAEKHPDKIIIVIAYRSTAEAPLREVPEKNIRISLSLSAEGGNPCQSHFNCQRNQKFMEIFKEWSRIAPGQIYVWCYCANFENRYSPFFPHDAMVERLRFFHENKVDGVFYNGIPRLFPQLFCYVQGKLLWDPGLDEKKLEDEFLKNFYGPAAPGMKDLLTLLRSRINDKHDPVHQGEYAAFDPIIEPVYLENALKIFSKAEAAVKDQPVYLRRVKYEKISAFLFPALDSRFLPDDNLRLDALRQLVETVYDCKIRRIKVSEGGQSAAWLEKKTGYRLPGFSIDSDTKPVPLIRELLECKTPEAINEFARKLKAYKVKNKTYVPTADGISFPLEGFTTNGAGWGPSAYSYHCEKRIAIGIFGGDSVETSFPVYFSRDAELKLSGLDHDKEGVVNIQILLNGEEIFKGRNGAAKDKWTDLSFPIPQKFFKSENKLVIKDLEKNDACANWFMFSKAEIVFK